MKINDDVDKNNTGNSESSNMGTTTMLSMGHDQVSVHAINQKYHGFFKINEYTLQHQQFSGQLTQIFNREIFERGDAVVVMPYDIARDKVLLIEQFRAGALNSTESPWLLEFIAGMFGVNESPEEVAIREAKEEANLNLSYQDLEPIITFYPSPGGTNEKLHLYLANFDSAGVCSGEVYGLPEENEDILLHLVSRTEALNLLAQGKITNAATIIGLQWLALNYSATTERESKA
jgi:ADP-ribose pyrophosphatase